MGISGSVDSKHKSTSSSKSRSPEPEVAKSVDEPRHEETLIVISPPTRASTPSSPNRDISPARARSHSFHDSRPSSATKDVKDADDVVDNSGNNGGESIGFSLEELATYCNADSQHRSDKDQLAGDEPTSESCDTNATETHDAESTADTSTSSNNVPLQVCGVKPPLVERPAQPAAVVEKSPESPSRTSETSTISESSSDSHQPNKKISSAEGTRKKNVTRLGETRPRRSSEAITEIAQAKKLSHRVVVAQKEKKTDAASNDKVVQRRHQNEQPEAATTPSPNNATGDELPKRIPSAKSVSATKSQQSTGHGPHVKQQPSFEEQQAQLISEATTDNKHSKKQKHHTTAARSSSDSKEYSTRQHHDKTAAKSSAPKTESKVPSTDKSGTSAGSNVNQKSQKSVPEKAASRPAAAAVADDYDDEGDDEDDWMNCITSLRDPDDIRNRKIEPKKAVSWPTKPSKPTKDEKTAEEEEEEEDEEKKKDSLLEDDPDCSRFRLY